MKTVRDFNHQFRCGLLGCLCVALLALQPVAAHAAMLRRPVAKPGATTMYESYRQIVSEARVPGSGATTSILLSGSKDTLTAPGSIPGTIAKTAYGFLFWDIDGVLYTHRTATFVAPKASTAFAATAWYLLTGGGGPGPTSVTTFGFSLPTDKKLLGTPIASVVPSSAWTPPSASVSTTTAVTITAANPGNFVRWLAPHATVSGTQLAVGVGISTIAIAFYGLFPSRVIPCHNHPPSYTCG